MKVNEYILEILKECYNLQPAAMDTLTRISAVLKCVLKCKYLASDKTRSGGEVV